MKHLLFYSLFFLLIACKPSSQKSDEQVCSSINDIKNEQIKNYHFLEPMYGDSYFPKSLVDEGKSILIQMCNDIETKKPKTNDELLAITHEATERFNQLNTKFFSAGSEIETVGREAIAADIDFIAKTYGFNADIEALISNRDW